MESVDFKWLIDHGVCVVILIVMYFWRIEPLLTDMNTKLAVMSDRLGIRPATHEDTK